jgi:hypothetical protein
MTNELVDKALQRVNDEREEAQIHQAKKLIRLIDSKREQRIDLAADIVKLQTELRELTVPEQLAENVLGN